MEVTADDEPLEAYSPLTIAHVLKEIGLQGAAGESTLQIAPRSDSKWTKHRLRGGQRT